MTIRQEEEQDIVAIRRVNEQGFGGKTEAKLVDRLRLKGKLALSLVAVEDNRILGHIAFSPVTVSDSFPGSRGLGLGPMSVLPDYQRRGIGSQLVRAGLAVCKKLGYGYVVLVGHPEYYPRFGFVPARPQGLDFEFDVPDEAWMVLELRKGALAERRGTVKYQPEFQEAV